MKDNKVKIIVVSAPKYVVCEIKPCPFCGGEAQVKIFTTRRARLFKEVSAKYIECKVCGCRTPLELEEQDAIDKWNRRV